MGLNLVISVRTDWPIMDTILVGSVVGLVRDDACLSGHPLSHLLGGAAVSMQSLLSVKCRLQIHLVAGIRDAQISIT